jgi:biopolymer transport protein ExbD
MRTRPQLRTAAAEIPTSSMADVAFLLIIFFLVTSTFAATRGLDFRLPEQQETAPIDPVEAVLVEVGPGGALRVDGRPMALAALGSYLRPRLRQDPAKPVIVRSDPAAPYGRMVDVLDELRQLPERLGLPGQISVAIPTQREVEAWPPLP